MGWPTVQSRKAAITRFTAAWAPAVPPTAITCSLQLSVANQGRTVTDEYASIHRQLLRDCDELLEWTITLHIAHSERVAFLVAWMPIAVHLLRRATVLDVVNADREVFASVEAKCNDVLGQAGHEGLPRELYLQAIAMQDGGSPPLHRP